MAFGGMNKSSSSQPMTEINMVPLIDVMLVLLIIFMVTAPLLSHTVKVDLPKASLAPNLTRPGNVQLAIDAESRMFWNGEAVDADQFVQRLASVAAQQPQPELHIRAERTIPYERVAQVISEAAKRGLTRIRDRSIPSEVVGATTFFNSRRMEWTPPP